MRIREVAGLGVGVLLAGAATQVVVHKTAPTPTASARQAPSVSQQIHRQTAQASVPTTTTTRATSPIIGSVPAALPTTDTVDQPPANAPCLPDTGTGYPACDLPLATPQTALPPATGYDATHWVVTEDGPPANPPDLARHLPLWVQYPGSGAGSGWMYFDAAGYAPFPARGHWAWVYEPQPGLRVQPSYTWAPGDPPVGPIP